MALIPSDLAERAELGGLLSPQIEATEEFEPSFMETTAASFRLENPVFSYFSRVRPEETAPFDPNYERFADIEGYEEHMARFAYADNDAEKLAIKKNIDREMEDRRIVAASGGLGIATMVAAGMTDPINFIPVGGAAYKTYKTTNSILKGATITAGIGVLGASASEVALQLTQETRTAGESAANVAASAFLSGLIGGGAVFLRGGRGKFKDLASRVDEDLTIPKVDEIDLMEPGSIKISEADLSTMHKSLSAMATGKVSAEDLELAPSFGIAKFLGKLPSPELGTQTKKVFDFFNDPITRTFTYVSRNAKLAMMSIAESPFIFKGDISGTLKREVPIESLIRQDKGALAMLNMKTDDSFIKYRKRMAGEPYKRKVADVQRTMVKDKMAGKSDDVLSFSEFKDKLDYSLRNLDKSDIPEVEEAAKPIREYLNYWLDRAQKSGLMPDEYDGNPVGALSYMMRQYDKNKIRAKRGKFTSVIEDWLLDEQKTAQKDVASFEARETGIKEEIADIRKKIRKVGGAAYAETFKKSFKETKSNLKEMFSVDDFEDIVLDKLAKPVNVEAKVNRAVDAALRKIFKQRNDVIFSDVEEELYNGFVDSIKGVVKAEDLGQSIDSFIKEVFPDIGIKVSDFELDFDAIQKVVTDEVMKKLAKSKKKAGSFDIDVQKLQELTEAEFDRFIQKRAKLAGKKAAKKAKSEAIEKYKEPLQKKVVELKEARKKQRSDLFFADRDIEEIRTRADQIVGRILGSPDGRLPYDLNAGTSEASISSQASPFLQGRKLTIDDNKIREFLVTDTEVTLNSYHRSVVPDVLMTERLGDVEGTKARQFITEEYTALIKEAGDGTKKAAKLEKEMDKALRDFTAVVQRLRGNYATMPGATARVSALSALKSFNIVRLMGGITMSSLPDLGRLTYLDGFGPAFRGTLKEFVSNPELRKLSMKDARLSGTALDLILEGRAHQVFDIADDFGGANKFNRSVSGATNLFMHSTGITKWNEILESFTSTLSSSKFIDAAEALVNGKATKWQRTRLNEIGVDKAVAQTIVEQYGKHGWSKGAVKLANLTDWDVDVPGVRVAYDIFSSGIARDVENIIIAPNQMKPLWLSGELGSFIGQFKSFTYAANTKTLVMSMQRMRMNPTDISTYIALSSQISLGVGVTYLKLAAAGKLYETTKDWGWQDWMVEGIDRSGIVGSLFEYNNILEKASGNRIGISRLMGKSPMTRYGQRNWTDALAGPSLGAVQDVATVAVGALGNMVPAEEGDGWTQEDSRALRRLLPFQNHIILRRLLNSAETGINDYFGFPERSGGRSGSRRE